MNIKYIALLFIILAGCTAKEELKDNKLSLAGEWQFRVDSLDKGISENWYNQSFDETVKLPGSMAENGKGDEVGVNTPWTGSIIDRSYFTAEKYAKYRQPGNIKIPFWLKPVKYYKGAAWYRKEVEVPDSWNGKRIFLFLERCHWETKVFVNGFDAGTKNSLSTPHQYDITDHLKPGRNIITIRVDNRVVIPVGVNSHSISDHTQSNWNGITGELSLIARPQVYINEIRIFPDVLKSSAKVIVSIMNPDTIDFRGKLSVHAESLNTESPGKYASKNVTIVTKSKEQQVIIEYKIRNPKLWDEFNPNLYKMVAVLDGNDKKVADSKSVEFGMREFKANGTRFEINGRPVFLRGTLECCIFPLTGYPPSDVDSWIKVLQVCRDYGLNHIRFHSWCPPEAAFTAADRMGFYFHVECASWANQGSPIGDGGPLDKYIYEEGDRIIKEYGNHPSFCMLAYGNEPSGRHHKEYLGTLLKYWKSIDNRRVYTSAAGWPIIPENDYNVPSEPRIQHWGEGLKSIINADPPQTMFDYRAYVSGFSIPVVSHEIGQWCVYPDFKEIEKYTGVLKATNFEIFRETLQEKNMGSQAEDFLMASGKLQALCYKAEIEAELRTPGLAGFQLLQLHDFPGQGTALVGVLNPFFESKGYVTPEEFRMFCNETVPLARLPKMVFRNSDTLKAEIEISHFGKDPLQDVAINCNLSTSEGEILGSETYRMKKIDIGNCNPVGSFSAGLSKVTVARKLILEVAVEGTAFKNRWELWVYPSEIKEDSGDVYTTENLDVKAQNILKNGGSVLLLTYGKVAKDKGAAVAIGFSSIFWNTAWTNNQPPHTLGILCDPGHPLFNDFPTEYHSNWQWWDPVTHSQAMILDDLPAGLKPLIQPVDTWFENRKLTLAFESVTGGGKLLVCSIDMKNDLDKRPVTQQLMKSLYSYMNSDAFNPVIKIGIDKINQLIK